MEFWFVFIIWKRVLTWSVDFCFVFVFVKKSASYSTCNPETPEMKVFMSIIIIVLHI